MHCHLLRVSGVKQRLCHGCPVYFVDNTVQYAFIFSMEFENFKFLPKKYASQTLFEKLQTNNELSKKC